MFVVTYRCSMGKDRALNRVSRTDQGHIQVRSCNPVATHAWEGGVLVAATMKHRTWQQCRHVHPCSRLGSESLSQVHKVQGHTVTQLHSHKGRRPTRPDHTNMCARNVCWACCTKLPALSCTSAPLQHHTSVHQTHTRAGTWRPTCQQVSRR